MKQVIVMLILSGLLFSCKQKTSKVLFDVNSAELLHQNQLQLNQVIIYDVFSPPVASRIYAYTSLAFYEAIRFEKPGHPSLAKKLRAFPEMPIPDSSKKYNYNLAATKAFFDVTHKVVFSIDSLKNYENDVLETFKTSMDEEEYNRSVVFGEAVAKKILERAGSDNYKNTRGMPKYLGSNADGKWQPTSPDYMDGTEPYWGTIKPFFLDSSRQCMPPDPPTFSNDKSSEFYKNAMEVYTIVNNLTDSQKTITRYWDDNPFVVEHTGHMMFATKKITPGGHWMGIAGIAAKKTGADIVKTSEVYALTSVALIDAFISSWEAKYLTQVIRPVTFINKSIDNRWEPFLQTPPFPEYPSAHSTISRSAATVLTNIFGDKFSFHDDSDKEYIGMEKDFASFYSASDEASISRVYGGIHYTSGIQGGIEQGKKIGKLITDKLIPKEGLATHQ